MSESLLAELQPRLGVISVGPNTYGHPTPESLDLLAGAGIPCARTDQRGDVSVSAVPTGLAAATTKGVEGGQGDAGPAVALRAVA